QSNLWFATWQSLKSNGSPYGFGGPWLQDDVTGKTPSDPYAFQGFTNRQLHISHENNFSIIFTIEIDKNGTGNWRKLTTLKVSPFGYKHHQFNDKLSAEWIRLTANRSGKYVTAYFHYGSGGGV